MNTKGVGTKRLRQSLYTVCYDGKAKAIPRHANMSLFHGDLPSELDLKL